MELWFSEKHTEDVKLSIRILKQLAHVESAYQSIDCYDTQEFGRMLTLDGFVMTTEKDEFIYHEMIVHPAMAVSLNAERVLVIGGGDGGVLRELSKYPGIKEMVLVEIDEAVVDVCKAHLPVTACGFNDPRVRLVFEDGMKFVRRCNNEFDLIIVDSTDPFGPGEGLFTKEFYGNCYNALKQNGLLVNQHESPFYRSDALAMQRAHKQIRSTFEICKVYQAHIPTYPSGHWLFGFAAKQDHPISGLQQNQWEALHLETRYYNCNLHRGCFALPTYVEELLKHVEEIS